jgi:hypothetical protein
MRRSVRGGVAAALLAGAHLALTLLAGSALAADPTTAAEPAPADPASGSDPLTLSGVIVDPATNRYEFFESLAGPSGSEHLLSGEFETAADGSFAIDLVRPQTPGQLSILIVEAADSATTTVDEAGCTTTRARGTTLRFDSAEALAAGPVTVRLTETYESGLCPPTIGSPDGTSTGVGATGQGPAPLPSPTPAPELAQAVLGVTATPPATEASNPAPPPAGGAPLWPALAGLTLVALAVLLVRFRPRRREEPSLEHDPHT